jgi:predicted phosphoribosyltransferase
MPTSPLFIDRREAGRALARRLAHHANQPDLLVLALPRGGVAVAYEVALALDAPLDVFVVRKLGFPGHAEFAMGAIASGGVRVINPLAGLKVTQAEIDRIARQEQIELERRERLYRQGLPPPEIARRRVIVVDDGLATGASMRAAVEAIRQQRPAHLCVAVPVGARDTCAALRDTADEVVCAAMPEPFGAVSLWYRAFPQATDGEVQHLLREAARRHATALH